MNDLSDPSDELYFPELTDDNQSSNKSPYSINTIQFSNIDSHTKKSPHLMDQISNKSKQ